MPAFSIHEAKAKLSRLIEKASAGEEVVITRSSKPVARLVPLGKVKGKLVVGPEFFEPLPKSELQTFR
jgi:prevent-host-death family protein